MLKKILLYPHPTLAKKALPVTEITDEIRQIATDMLDTLKHVGGAGLAAPQIGELVRMVLVDKNLEDAEAEESDYLLIINPELEILDKSPHTENEGCLSVDDLRSEVSRPSYVRMTGIDLENKPVSIEGRNYLSACIQHEYDHLEGKTFLVHLSFLKRSLYQKKIQKNS